MSHEPFPSPPARRLRSRRRPGTTWLIAFLAATFGLALWLAYQAQDAARSHREAATGALRDYARTAAWQYSRIASENMESVLETLFDDVPRRVREGRLPSPQVVARDVDDALRRAGCACPELREPPFVFRAALPAGRVVAEPDTVPTDVLGRLADALAGQARATTWRDGVIVLSAGAVLQEDAAVAYSFSEDAAGDLVAYGAVFGARAFGRLFEEWYARGELLPATMTQSAPNDSLLHVAVRGPAGVTLFESGIAYADALAGADTLREDYGSLVVEASVRPDAAARLIIGGLPTSRLPLILGLLALTLGLGAAALLQVRRERQLARLRDDFISSVSHELRTPLAQIRMFAELQEAGKLRTTEERERAVRVINRETQRLTHLVENILRYSHLRRATERTGGRETVDLDGAVSEILEAFRPLAAGRNMHIATAVDDRATVIAHRDAVKQIVVNLLDNAVKYGPVGQTIRVGAARRGSAVRITVEDEGPGIPRQERTRVWEPYRRLDRPIEARMPGTGIGLAVVRQLADASGGKAWVEEGSGGSARFVVELPAPSQVAVRSATARSEVPA
jgi:signal transduction histidine kinase